MYSTFDKDKNNAIDIVEFNELIKTLYEERDKYEVDCLFRHCDLRGVGTISKEDFKAAIYNEFNFDIKIKTTLHELLAPLKTKLGRDKLTNASLFDKFTKNKTTITI